MEFWYTLYQDNLKEQDMNRIREEVTYNYPIEETEGPTFEEVNEIMQNINIKKATSGIIKP